MPNAITICGASRLMSTLQHLLALASAREANPWANVLVHSNPLIATSSTIVGDVVFIISWPNVVNYSFTLVLDKHPCKVIPRERIATRY